MSKMVWRPIETAPKNGTEVLITDGHTIVVAVYRAGNHPTCSWCGTYGDGDASWDPTHWMPLPAPPKAEDAEPTCWDGEHQSRPAVVRVRITDRFDRTYEQDVCGECLEFLRENRRSVVVMETYDQPGAREEATQ